MLDSSDGGSRMNEWMNEQQSRGSAWRHKGEPVALGATEQTAFSKAMTAGGAPNISYLNLVVFTILHMQHNHGRRLIFITSLPLSQKARWDRYRTTTMQKYTKCTLFYFSRVGKKIMQCNRRWSNMKSC